MSLRQGYYFRTRGPLLLTTYMTNMNSRSQPIVTQSTCTTLALVHLLLGVSSALALPTATIAGATVSATQVPSGPRLLRREEESSTVSKLATAILVILVVVLVFIGYIVWRSPFCIILRCCLATSRRMEKSKETPSDDEGRPEGK